MVLILSAARCDKGWECEAALERTQTLARFTGAFEETTFLAIEITHEIPVSASVSCSPYFTSDSSLTVRTIVYVVYELLLPFSQN